MSEKEIEIENLKQEVSALKSENEELKATAEKLEADKNYAWKIYGEKSEEARELRMRLEASKRMIDAFFDVPKA